MRKDIARPFPFAAPRPTDRPTGRARAFPPSKDPNHSIAGNKGPPIFDWSPTPYRPKRARQAVPARTVPRRVWPRPRFPILATVFGRKFPNGPEPGDRRAIAGTPALRRSRQTDRATKSARFRCCGGIAGLAQPLHGLFQVSPGALPRGIARRRGPIFRREDAKRSLVRVPTQGTPKSLSDRHARRVKRKSGRSALDRFIACRQPHPPAGGEHRHVDVRQPRGDFTHDPQRFVLHAEFNGQRQKAFIGRERNGDLTRLGIFRQGVDLENRLPGGGPLVDPNAAHVAGIDFRGERNSHPLPVARLQVPDGHIAGKPRRLMPGLQQHAPRTCRGQRPIGGRKRDRRLVGVRGVAPGS